MVESNSPSIFEGRNVPPSELSREVSCFRLSSKKDVNGSLVINFHALK